MSDSRASLEIIAPSVEEAVARGLADLGLPEEAVEVEILDAGAKGLFGLGFRQARVRLTIKGAEHRADSLVEAQAASQATASQAAASQAAAPQAAAEKAPEAQVAPAGATAPRVASAASAAADAVAKAPEAVRQAAVELDESLLDVARDTVEELLKAMKVRARVSVQMGSPEDPQDRTPVQVDIRGDDLSILIGPKAETLNALQYIAALIISKEIGHSIPLVVDVEGYRARRSQQIRQLARRMAEQAVRTGRRQALEPMPASERRLVHIELRDNPQVSTESVGEEPRRKVTIVPK
jgi:spoIIIJ-associated protein